MNLTQLSETNLRDAAHWLAERDDALARVLDCYGYPPLWYREPGFSTLIHMILEQQVSLASANAAFQRLSAHLGVVSPENLLQLDDDSLRQIGFSRQKMQYARLLAQSVLAGELIFEKLSALPDEEVRSMLTRQKGIGDWTADIYLSECLLRPDILPKGDIALLEAFRVIKGLPARPTHRELESGTAHWRPLRSAGIRMLWHFYLCERRRG